MRTSTLARVILGVVFLIAGGAKTKRFGKEYVPDSYEYFEKNFEKGFKYFLLKDTVKISAGEYQEIVGYTEVILGFLLLTGQLVTISSLILMAIMLNLFYTLHKLNYPLHQQAMPIFVFVVLLTLVGSDGRKEKQD